jgi:hypothetical protein
MTFDSFVFCGSLCIGSCIVFVWSNYYLLHLFIIIISFSCILFSADGTYALKKVLIQSDQHLELVRQEIKVSSQFSHPNLLPLLENAIIAVKVSWIQIHLISCLLPNHDSSIHVLSATTCHVSHWVSNSRATPSWSEPAQLKSIWW